GDDAAGVGGRRPRRRERRKRGGVGARRGGRGRRGDGLGRQGRAVADAGRRQPPVRPERVRPVAAHGLRRRRGPRLGRRGARGLLGHPRRRRTGRGAVVSGVGRLTVVGLAVFV